jgi:hypothetical protein
MKRLVLLAALAQAACFKGALAPHLSRESELGAAAASDRFGTVLDKATAFERQNEKSRDVFWYRLWRAGAMIEMGQVQEGLQLIDAVMREVAVAGKTPAQPDRFRMFGHDLQARGLLMLNRPAEALAHLERAYGLADEVGLETGGDCNVEIMMAARSQQIEEVAQRAGDPSRATTARAELARHVDRWTKCLTSRDFPGLRSVGTLAATLKKNGTDGAPPPPAVAPPPPPAVAPPPPPPARPAPPPPAPVKPAAPAGIASLPMAGERFAPIDATPYQHGIDAAMPLVRRHAGKAAAGSMSISSDGRHRALRVDVPKALSSTEDLVPLFEATVVFFEQTRGVQAGADRVIVATKDFEVMAAKADIFDLFVDKIDAGTFASRLQRIR